METYPFDIRLYDEDDVIDFFVKAVDYRDSHKSESSQIAIHVFDYTHPQVGVSFPISSQLYMIRDEFGALEAPGAPDDENTEPDEYVDQLWLNIVELIQHEKENRTV